MAIFARLKASRGYRRVARRTYAMIEEKRRYEKSAAHSSRTSESDVADRFRNRSWHRGASSILSRSFAGSNRRAH
jgi:hypothetical protein